MEIKKFIKQLKKEMKDYVIDISIHPQTTVTEMKMADCMLKDINKIINRLAKKE